jgi:hypothetical protein
MSKYLVKSGDLNITVRSDNHKLAAMDAIRKGKPKSLGVLIGILKKGDDEAEEIFMLTQKVLEDMGHTIEEALNIDTNINRYKKPLTLNHVERAKEIGPGQEFLTEKEFKAGKPGYVWINETTGKLHFPENAKKKK